MDVNYLEIVIKGYFDKNNREFLDRYFLREFKKAEKQDYSLDEFFSGCLKVIENWEENLQKQVLERKKELHEMLIGAKNGTLLFTEMKGKTIEQERQETIEYCGNELKDVRPDGIGSLTFKVHLYSFTNGRIAYNMAYNEVLQIKYSIAKVYNENKLTIERQQPINFIDEVNAVPKADNEEKPNGKENKYPRIFSSVKAFLIFERLHEHYKENRYQLANYSFIYWQMKKDTFIFNDIGNHNFMEFLSENYSITLDKLKTFNKCITTEKLTMYSLIKQDIKI